MEKTSSEAPTTRNLNDLPEELLLHILSFLPTLDSVQTSLISRKWRPLWSRVPSLNFNYQLFPPYEPPLDTRQFYAEFIDRVLISRPNSPVHTFRLSFIYHHHYAAHVDSWLRSAVTNLRAWELYLHFFIDLNFHNDESRNHIYDFRFSLLRNGCVEKLSLTRCDLRQPAKLSAMGFGSIGSVILNRVYLTDQTVEDLILGCPNLEVLELRGCVEYHHLKIRSRMLKRLVLEVGDFYDAGSGVNETVLVDCPKLYLIDFNGCWFKQLVLENASSLVEFRVDVMHLMEGYNYWSKAVRLLEQVPHLKHFSVQNWWFKFLTSKDTLPKSFMLYNLNRLELRTGFTQYDLVGMAALLKISPNLETMILDYLCKFSEDESLQGDLLDKPVEFSMPCLKQVTLKVYNDTEAQVDFIEMLIRQEVVLEKLVLVPCKFGEKKSYPPMVFNRKDIQNWKHVLSFAEECSDSKL